MTPSTDAINDANMYAMMEAMKTQIWVMTYVIGAFFTLLTVFAGTEWKSMRRLLTDHEAEIQETREWRARQEGGKSVAQAVVDGCEIVADAIDKKHGKR